MEKQDPPPAYTDDNQPLIQPPGYGAPPAYNTQPQPGYPPASAPTPQHPHQLAPQHTTVLINTTHAMSEHPMRMICPSCQKDIITRVKYHNGLLTWLLVFGLFIMGLSFGCCLIPLCIDGVKDVDHLCPTCYHKIGTKKRL